MDVGGYAHDCSPNLDAAPVKYFLAAIFSIFAIFPQLGIAETISATNGVSYSVGGIGSHATGQAACQAFWDTGARYGATSLADANMATLKCQAWYGGTLSTNWATIVASNQLQCPANQNWTLSGSNCTRPDCQPGETRNQVGVCVSQCVAKAGQNVGSAISGSGAISGGSCLVGACASVGGCAVGNCSQGTQSGTGAATKWVFSGCQYTGDPQTSVPANPVTANPPTTTPESCLARGQSYITSSSGATTCIKPTDSPATQPTTTTTRSTRTENNTTTTTTNETTCAGGNCNSITTNAGPTNDTVNTSGGSNSFCQQNPTNPMCTGKGETKDPCEDNPDRLGCQTPEAPAEEGAIDTTTKGVASITVTPFASAAQCPANVALPKGATFKWEPICDLATGVKPILIALAWLSAGLIVMGAFKE